MHPNFKAKEDKSFKSGLIWKGIYDSYIKYVGLSEDYKELLRLKQECHGLKCDLIITENNFLNNYISIAESQIKSIESRINNHEQLTNGESVEMLQDVSNRDIDVWKISVQEFYSRTKHYTEKRRKEVSLINSKKAA